MFLFYRGDLCLGWLTNCNKREGVLSNSPRRTKGSFCMTVNGRTQWHPYSCVFGVGKMLHSQHMQKIFALMLLKPLQITLNEWGNNHTIINEAGSTKCSDIWVTFRDRFCGWAFWYFLLELRHSFHLYCILTNPSTCMNAHIMVRCH